MAKRVTIMISDTLDKEVRERQANLIKKTHSSISYSYVVNELIDKALRGRKL